MALRLISTAVLGLLIVAQASYAGVLIGQMPEKGGVDIRDLKWTVEGDTIRIMIVAAGPDGKLAEHPLRPLPAALVRQSLRYAADGRPLTVTMIKADPLVDLKILLHPALVDTPLGQKAIRLDQLVDQFTKDLRERRDVTARVDDQHALYRLAWASRARIAINYERNSLGRIADPDDRKQVEDEVNALSGLADRYLTDKLLRAQARRALDALDQIRAPNSLLKTKREFYDEELVDAICRLDAKSDLDSALEKVGKPLSDQVTEIWESEREAERFDRDVKNYNDKSSKLKIDIDEFNRDVRRRERGNDGLQPGLPGVGGDANRVEEILRRLRQRESGMRVPGAGRGPLGADDFEADVGLQPGLPGVGGDTDRVDEILRGLRQRNSGMRVPGAGRGPLGADDFGLLETRRARLEKRQEELRRSSEQLEARQKSLKQSAARAQEASKRVVTRALPPPPEFIVWSGVREQTFTGELADYCPDLDRPTKVFRFMVQVAFTTPPVFLKDGSEAADYSDESPFEFADIEPVIEETVEAGVRRDREAADAVRLMAEFTVVQRIARAGLAGKFGQQFPEERLADLARAVGDGGKETTARTMHWLPRSGSIETSGLVKLALAAGVGQKDVESLLKVAWDDFLIRVLLRPKAMERFEALGKSENPEDRRAGAALKQCYELLEEQLASRKAFQQRVDRLSRMEQKAGRLPLSFPIIQALAAGSFLAAREFEWAAFVADQEKWLGRWTVAASSFAPDGETPARLREAASALAQTDYSLQARHRMRVIDDEKAIFLQARGASR